MRLDKFTEKTQEALQGAAELARESGKQAVEPHQGRGRHAGGCSQLRKAL